MSAGSSASSAASRARPANCGGSTSAPPSASFSAAAASWPAACSSCAACSCCAACCCCASACCVASWVSGCGAGSAAGAAPCSGEDASLGRGAKASASSPPTIPDGRLRRLALLPRSAPPAACQLAGMLRRPARPLRAAASCTGSCGRMGAVSPLLLPCSAAGCTGSSSAGAMSCCTAAPGCSASSADGAASTAAGACSCSSATASFSSAMLGDGKLGCRAAAGVGARPSAGAAGARPAPAWVWLAEVWASSWKRLLPGSALRPVVGLGVKSAGHGGRQRRRRAIGTPGRGSTCKQGQPRAASPALLRRGRLQSSCSKQAVAGSVKVSHQYPSSPHPRHRTLWRHRAWPAREKVPPWAPPPPLGMPPQGYKRLPLLQG